MCECAAASIIDSGVILEVQAEETVPIEAGGILMTIGGSNVTLISGKENLNLFSFIIINIKH